MTNAKYPSNDPELRDACDVFEIFQLECPKKYACVLIRNTAGSTSSAIMPIALHFVAEAKKVARHPTQPSREKRPFLDHEMPATSAPPRTTIGTSRRILVVDDNPVVLKAFELKLQADGFTVVTLSKAAGVASAAEKAGAELIILDINFPADGGLDWNGYNIMQWLRRFPELAGIPVILISGEEAKRHKEKALAEGAAAFFQKPVAYPELLASILHTLRIQK